MKEKNIAWYGTVFVLMGIAFVTLLRTAWIADDAAITLRCVLNFLNGYGPNFNIDERVQAYTHPLWFLLLSVASFICDNIFLATFVVSIGISLIVRSLILLKAPTRWGGIAAFTLLLLSKAYIDFSTSGLENPLSHLLILLSILIGLDLNHKSDSKHIFIFSLTSASIYLSRPDLILLLAPWACLIIATHYRKSFIPALLAGLLPSLAWTIFSVIYYGMPFPNSAYAKLYIETPLLERIFYGCRYIAETFWHYPLTTCAIAVGIVAGLMGSSKMKALALGVTLYLFYVILIGGDFMSGRFLTAPFLVAVIILTFFDFNRFKMIAIATLILIGLVNIDRTVLSDSSYHTDGMGPWGITDERGFYYQSYGLLPLYKKGALSHPLFWEKDVSITGVTSVTGGLGFKALAMGPNIHVIDLMAIADPLLVKLSPITTDAWRAGHLVRQLPIGYTESIFENNNQLRDKKLAAYYNIVRTVTRGDVFSWDRFAAIWALNYNSRPDFRYYSVLSDELTPPLPVKYESLPKNIIETGAWMSDNNVLFEEWMILDVVFAAPTTIHEIDLSLNDQQTFLIKYSKNGEFKTLATITGESENEAHTLLRPSTYNLPINKKLIRHTLNFKNDAPIIADRLRIIPIGKGDGLYGLGHLQVK